MFPFFNFSLKNRCHLAPGTKSQILGPKFDELSEP